MMQTGIARGKRLKARLGVAGRRFASDCSASVAIEYIVAAAIIGAGVIVGVSVLSGTVTELYGTVIDKFAG